MSNRIEIIFKSVGTSILLRATGFLVKVDERVAPFPYTTLPRSTSMNNVKTLMMLSAYKRSPLSSFYHFHISLLV